MIKVDIISGFLGAGKTTLIKKLFESAYKNEMVVLIENEFGEIGIDSSFLKSSGVEIKEINAGCICCSLVGDFSEAINELIAKYHPDRIVIEPSGVGKLSDIINAIKHTSSNDLTLNVLTTVVDGPKSKMYLKNFGEFFSNQVEAASTIVISKSKKMDHHQMEDLVDTIRHMNKKANIITTPINEFDSLSLLKILETTTSLQKDFEDSLLHEIEEDHEHEHCCCHHHHEDEDHEHLDDCHDHHEHDHEHQEHCCCHDHHEHDHEHHSHSHHADEVFTSWGKETTKSVSYDKLDMFLTLLKLDESLGFILRSKGIIKANDDDTWYHFDFVAGDYEIRKGDPDTASRIVVIGSKLNLTRIETLFEAL